jgi:hypothetical protein
MQILADLKRSRKELPLATLNIEMADEFASCLRLIKPKLSHNNNNEGPSSRANLA